jgi:hypothetical protein
LAVRELRAPDTVAVARPFPVHVHIGDPRGVASVELRFGGERHVLPARGEREARLSTRITPRRAGVVQLEVAPLGTDGARGPMARTVVVVTPRARAPARAMTRPTLERRIADWKRRGLTEDAPYARGPLYRGSPTLGTVPVTKDWWIHWTEGGGRQPFDWASHCESTAPGITPNGEVLRCWLALNPQVAVSIIWDELLSNGYAHPVPYPFWPEWRKKELDQVFFSTYKWLESGLQMPFPNPADPAVNRVPPTFPGSNIALTEHDAWLLYEATVAHSLALEIGGFVPWSIVDYDADDLGGMFHSRAMFEADDRTYGDFAFAGYWVEGVLGAFPKTSFAFFVQQDIIRSTHQSTITRLLGWSGSHLAHYADFNGDTDGKSPMEVAYIHWQYYGDAPVQRMLAGTLRDNTTEVAHWTRGCSGTSAMYESILRALNIPARTMWGWGDGIEPHLDGHTVPVFPTIGKTLSHGDDVLNWGYYLESVSPPPASVSPKMLLISWDTFVDWFYTHPDSNVGRRRHDDIPIQLLDDDILDLYCSDLASGLSHGQSSVYQRFSDHYTVAELERNGLWTRLAQKATTLHFCDG